MERIFITSGTYTHDFLATFVLKGVTLPLIVSWILVAYLSLASQIKVFILPLLPMTVQVIIVDEDCSNRVGFYLEGTGSVYLALRVVLAVSLKAAILKGIF